jgi:hypothetical protein
LKFKTFLKSYRYLNKTHNIDDQVEEVQGILSGLTSRCNMVLNHLKKIKFRTQIKSMPFHLKVYQYDICRYSWDKHDILLLTKFCD